MNGQTLHEQTLIEKIRDLPPEKVVEVEDLVDFLRQRDEDRRLVRAPPSSLKTPSKRSGTIPTMPNTTDYEFGDIVPVPFPFTDQTASKKRPAVVVSSGAYNRQRADIVLMAITSQVKSPSYFGDIAINDWQLAGLLKPSVIKPIFATIEKRCWF